MARPQYRAALVVGSYEQDGKRKDRTVNGGAGWEGANGKCINIMLDAVPVPVDGKIKITLWRDDEGGDSAPF